MEINSYLKDLCENNDYQPQEAFNPISTRGVGNAATLVTLLLITFYFLVY